MICEHLPQARVAALTYRGGPLLTAVQLYTLFWGAAWQDAAQQATARVPRLTLQKESVAPNPRR